MRVVNAATGDWTQQDDPGTIAERVTASRREWAHRIRAEMPTPEPLTDTELARAERMQRGIRDLRKDAVARRKCE
jgi:hypothetical protein